MDVSPQSSPTICGCTSRSGTARLSFPVGTIRRILEFPPARAGGAARASIPAPGGPRDFPRSIPRRNNRSGNPRAPAGEASESHGADMLAQIVVADARVHHRRREPFVPEEILDRRERHAGIHQARGEAVAQNVRTNPPAAAGNESGLVGGAADRAPGSFSADRKQPCIRSERVRRKPERRDRRPGNRASEPSGR